MFFLLRCAATLPHSHALSLCFRTARARFAAPDDLPCYAQALGSHLCNVTSKPGHITTYFIAQKPLSRANGAGGQAASITETQRQTSPPANDTKSPIKAAPAGSGSSTVQLQQAGAQLGPGTILPKWANMAKWASGMASLPQRKRAAAALGGQPTVVPQQVVRPGQDQITGGLAG